MAPGGTCPHLPTPSYATAMSDPFPLILSFFIYQSSFISNHCQYFLICDLFSPTEFFNSSPYSRFEGLRSFISTLLIVHTAGHYMYIAVFLPFVIKDFSISGAVLGLIWNHLILNHDFKSLWWFYYFYFKSLVQWWFMILISNHFFLDSDFDFMFYLSKSFLSTSRVLIVVIYLVVVGLCHNYEGVVYHVYWIFHSNPTENMIWPWWQWLQYWMYYYRATRIIASMDCFYRIRCRCRCHRYH